MKTILYIFITLTVLFTCTFSQTVQETKEAPVNKYAFWISYSGGIVNPSVLNDRIANNNGIFESSVDIIESVKNFSVGLMLRPLEDEKIIVFRYEPISLTRTFPVSIQKTTTSPTITGTSDGEIKEQYSVTSYYLGIGLATLKNSIRADVGMIYGTSEMVEEGSFPNSHYSHTSTSDGYGLRASIQPILNITKNINIDLELAYRLILISDFRDAKGATVPGFEIKLNGFAFSAGIEVQL